MSPQRDCMWDPERTPTTTTSDLSTSMSMTKVLSNVKWFYFIHCDHIEKKKQSDTDMCCFKSGPVFTYPHALGKPILTFIKANYIIFRFVKCLNHNWI